MRLLRAALLPLVVAFATAFPHVAAAAECATSRYFYAGANSSIQANQTTFQAKVSWTALDVTGWNDHAQLAWTVNSADGSSFVEVGVYTGASTATPTFQTAPTVFTRFKSETQDITSAHVTVKSPITVEIVRSAAAPSLFSVKVNGVYVGERNWPIPTDVRWVQAFLEDANFTPDDALCEGIDGYFATKQIKWDPAYAFNDHPFHVCFANRSNFETWGGSVETRSYVDTCQSTTFQAAFAPRVAVAGLVPPPGVPPPFPATPLR